MPKAYKPEVLRHENKTVYFLRSTKLEGFYVSDLSSSSQRDVKSYSYCQGADYSKGAFFSEDLKVVNKYANQIGDVVIEKQTDTTIVTRQVEEVSFTLWEK